MKKYITSPDNSPKGTLMDHPTAVTAPPYELVGNFFTIEIDSSKTDLFRELPKVLNKYEKGEIEEYVGGGNGHDVRIANDQVKIETIYGDPQQYCVVSFADFKNALSDWRRFVKRKGY